VNDVVFSIVSNNKKLLVSTSTKSPRLGAVASVTVLPDIVYEPPMYFAESCRYVPLIETAALPCGDLSVAYVLSVSSVTMNLSTSLS